MGAPPAHGCRTPFPSYLRRLRVLGWRAPHLLVVIAQFYSAFVNIDGELETAEDFFKAYLALPVLMFFVVWVSLEEGGLVEDRVD
jgi:amino acid permease